MEHFNSLMPSPACPGTGSPDVVSVNQMSLIASHDNTGNLKIHPAVLKAASFACNLLSPVLRGAHLRQFGKHLISKILDSPNEYP